MYAAGNGDKVMTESRALRDTFGRPHLARLGEDTDGDRRVRRTVQHLCN